MSRKDIEQILQLNEIKNKSGSDADYNKALHIFARELQATKKNTFEFQRILSIIENYIYGVGAYESKS